MKYGINYIKASQRHNPARRCGVINKRNLFQAHAAQRHTAVGFSFKFLVTLSRFSIYKERSDFFKIILHKNIDCIVHGKAFEIAI